MFSFDRSFVLLEDIMEGNWKKVLFSSPAFYPVLASMILVSILGIIMMVSFFAMITGSFITGFVLWLAGIALLTRFQFRVYRNRPEK